MKKHEAITFLLFFLLSPATGSAGEEEYNDCILEHLKGAKLDVAASLIRNACYENYGSIFKPSKDVRLYNECLLRHLVGVENFHAAMELRSACASKYLK